MKTGNIHYINKEKGFGFITPLGKDSSIKENNVFFHCTRVVEPKFEELERLDKVDYLELDTEKGITAVDIVANQK